MAQFATTYNYIRSCKDGNGLDLDRVYRNAVPFNFLCLDPDSLGLKRLNRDPDVEGLTSSRVVNGS